MKKEMSKLPVQTSRIPYQEILDVQKRFWNLEPETPNKREEYRKLKEELAMLRIEDYENTVLSTALTFLELAEEKHRFLIKSREYSKKMEEKRGQMVAMAKNEEEMNEFLDKKVGELSEERNNARLEMLDFRYKAIQLFEVFRAIQPRPSLDVPYGQIPTPLAGTGSAAIQQIRDHFLGRPDSPTE